jgi:hypothetical protein
MWLSGLGLSVEATNYAEIYLTSLENYQQYYRGNPGRAIDNWKMTPVFRKRYKEDKLVKYIRIEFQSTNWEW